MIVGITGPSGSGKTTVGRIFEKNGFFHIDCDQVVHNIVYNDKAVLTALTSVFGDDIAPCMVLDRKKLGSIVFSDNQQYQRLTNTVNPFIITAITRIINNCGKKDIVIDAPLLFESSLDAVCDFVIAVITSTENSIERVIKRDGIDEHYAYARLSRQMQNEQYAKYSHITIENNGTEDELINDTLVVIKKLTDRRSSFLKQHQREELSGK